jgi:8-oxo-dGTP pyrophosphatase MutT (NUDIX family)
MELFFSNFPAIAPRLIQLISKALSGPLPGREAQYRMAPADRTTQSFPVREDVREAAVLVNLYQKDYAWHTVLIKRIEKEGDRHSGQMSFPGGRRENNEPLHFTAVRESSEEINSPIEDVQILGSLSPLHVPVSNFLVTPFVGYCEALDNLIPQESEVAAIVEIPLQTLLAESTRQQIDIRVRQSVVLHRVPCFLVDDRIIWGATAMMLSEFLSILDQDKQIQQELSNAV